MCSILLVTAVGGIYLNNARQQYDKGLSDGKKDLFARSNTPWYRRGYEAGLSDVAKFKAIGQQPSLTAVIHADPNEKMPVPAKVNPMNFIVSEWPLGSTFYTRWSDGTVSATSKSYS